MGSFFLVMTDRSPNPVIGRHSLHLILGSVRGVGFGFVGPLLQQFRHFGLLLLMLIVVSGSLALEIPPWFL